MTNIECNNIADTTGEFVTMSDITNALKVAREYVYSRILPYVEHKKDGHKIMVNKTSLSNWLIENAEFTRQTVFVPEWLVEDYKSKFKVKYPTDTFEENPRKCSKNRLIFPFRRVKPFDVWELAVQGNLIHAKLMTDSGNNVEKIYRDMFVSGAIKIKLGRSKTMFYIPESEGVLCPAIDEVIEESPKKEPLREIKTLDGMVIIKGDPIITKSVKNLLNRHYRIKSTKNEEERLEVEIYKQFQSVDGVIVTRLHFD